MRHHANLLAIVILAVIALGCFIPPPGAIRRGHRRPRHPPPPARHDPDRHRPAPQHEPRCEEACVQWREERRCERRCRRRGPPLGQCVRWEQHCRPERVCARHERRCH